MKILIVASIDNNPYNGVPRAVPGMVNALQDTLMEQSIDNQIAFVNVRGIMIDGIDCQIVPSKYTLNEMPTGFKRPDLVIFHEVYYAAFIRLGNDCRKYCIPYIIIPHGCLTKEALEIKKWKKRIGNELLFKKFVMGAEALQFLSPSEKRKTIFKKDGFVGLNGVSDRGEAHSTASLLVSSPAETDIQRSRVSSNKSYTVYTYIGRLDMHIKGLDILIKAVAETQKTLRENLCIFKLYGPDCYDSKRKLTLLSEELGVGDLIEINGPVEEEKKEEVLLKTDIFIQTSRSEALPMGLLEALSYGIPCLVSKGTGLARLINKYDAGWGEKKEGAAQGKETEEAKVHSLAELIVSSINDKTTYPQKSENAHQLIKEYFEIKKRTERLLVKYKKYTN
jgi:glycosyltransferase involved in cell wall biosynthesis